jgi:hypothetical protein
MDIGVLILNDDTVRLPVYVLNQLDLRCVCEAFDTYRENRRKREAEQKSAASVKERNRRCRRRKRRAAREEIRAVLEQGEPGTAILRKALKQYRKGLPEGVKKLEKHRRRREIMGERNSYAKTDRGAALMRMNDESLNAVYNVQLAVEGEYITGTGIFRNPNEAEYRIWKREAFKRDISKKDAYTYANNKKLVVM